MRGQLGLKLADSYSNSTHPIHSWTHLWKRRESFQGVTGGGLWYRSFFLWRLVTIGSPPLCSTVRLNCHDCLAGCFGSGTSPRAGRVLVLSLARNQGDHTWVSGILFYPLGILGESRGRRQLKKREIPLLVRRVETAWKKEKENRITANSQIVKKFLLCEPTYF